MVCHQVNVPAYVNRMHCLLPPLDTSTIIAKWGTVLNLRGEVSPVVSPSQSIVSSIEARAPGSYLYC